MFGLKQIKIITNDLSKEKLLKDLEAKLFTVVHVVRLHGLISQVNPEAPSGSFRRKDLEREAGNAGKKANVGLDGKVYAFIDAPSDESSAEGIQKGAPLSLAQHAHGSLKTQVLFQFA